MSMNFPNVPVPGQIYASPGGPVYRFDDPVWSPIPDPGFPIGIIVSLYYLAVAAQVTFPLTTPDRFGNALSMPPPATALRVYRSGTRITPSDGYTLSGSTVTLAWPAGDGEAITIDIGSNA